MDDKKVRDEVTDAHDAAGPHSHLRAAGVIGPCEFRQDPDHSDDIVDRPNRDHIITPPALSPLYDQDKGRGKNDIESEVQQANRFWQERSLTKQRNTMRDIAGGSWVYWSRVVRCGEVLSAWYAIGGRPPLNDSESVVHSER